MYGKYIHTEWVIPSNSINVTKVVPCVLWPSGPLVFWSSGLFWVLSSLLGPLVIWSSGPLVSSGSSGLLGPLVIWSSGPLVSSGLLIALSIFEVYLYNASLNVLTTPENSLRRIVPDKNALLSDHKRQSKKNHLYSQDLRYQRQILEIKMKK